MRLANDQVRQAASLAGGWKPVTSWTNRDEAFTSIAEGLRKVVTRGGTTTASSRHRPNNLPFLSLGKLFKGRADFLASLGKHLASGNGRATAIVARHAVHGLGGVGKTRAAVEYAWEHEADYSALLFVSGPTAPALRANLADLAELLGIAITPSVDEQMDAVLGWLEAHPGWLLILDNVDTEDAAREAERLLVRLRSGHVLITSRISNWGGGVEALELEVLDEEDAVSYLLERASRRRKAPGEQDAASAVARELGGLALGLEQAGAYINRLRLSFADYLARWRDRRDEVLAWHDERLMGYPASVAITWVTTFEQLPEPERRLLQVLAWLAPEPIPLVFLDAEPLARALPDPRAALGGLAAFSLLKFAETGDAVLVHRLVQEVARGRGEPADRTASLTLALDALDAVPAGDPQDVRTWHVWTSLGPHVAAATSHSESAGLTGPTSRLMNDLGLFLKVRCQFPQAEPLYRRALAIDEASYGPDHPNVAIDLNNLAHCCRPRTGWPRPSR